MHEFTNKVVVITGGNSGIGLATAKAFGQSGAKVVIFGRNQQKLDEAVSALPQALAIQGDVSNISDLDYLFKETHSKFGGIDVVVASAGIAGARQVSDVDEKFFDEIVNVNYKGLYFTAQRSLAYLNQGASIIFISSAAAHVGWPGHSVYASTKAAVSHLARGLSADLVSRGIRVNAISPGLVDTPIFDGIRESDPEAMKRFAENTPTHKFASPEDIAGAALYLASPQSAYIIGADLVIDGGLSAIFPAKT